MDALTALSVASSVIAFVDFGSKILSHTEQIYKSHRGILSTVVDVETITKDIDQLTEGLRRNLPEFRPLPHLEQGSRTEDDEALDRLCKRCHEIATVMTKRIRALQPSRKERSSETSQQEQGTSQATSGPRAVSAEQALQLGGDGSVADEVNTKRQFSKWKSFKKALATSWSKSEMEEMAATLKDFRGEIEFRILISIRRTLNETATQTSQTSHQISRSTQIILDSFLNARDELADLLRVQAKRIIEIQEMQANREIHDVQRHNDVLRGEIEAGSFHVLKSSGVSRDFEPASYAQEAQLEGELRALVAENEILGALSYATLDDRRESIDLPHIETFEWIYEEPDSTDRRWSNFVEWIRTGSGIYWMNGKVGSGKSTLMRYIFEHEKTTRNAQVWAGKMPVKVCGFFFWRSGNEEQRSQRGLLRSLLYTMLQGHRDLIPEVFPEAWSVVSSRTTGIVCKRLPPDSPLLPAPLKPLTMAELKKAFRKLLCALEDRVKTFLVIDGLDEYEGDYLDIVELFHECAKSPAIKLCLSSRPLLVFEQAFAELPGMRLQDLTRGDITRYVTSRLCSHNYMVRLSVTHPAETSNLIDEIVNKASGVFLWVKLVVRSLLRGLCDQNRISDLRARVEELPEDMEALYNHMLNNTDRIYYKQASRLFQIFRAAQQTSPSRLTLLHLSWADEENQDWAEKSPMQPLQQEEISFRCEMMDARLKSVCAGLLESNTSRSSSRDPDSKVMFLHRTVSDWITQNEVWTEILARTADDVFSPNLEMLKSRLLCLKSLEIAPREPLDMSIVSDALTYAVLAEKDLNRAFPKLIDQIDNSASVQWRKHDANMIQNHGALLFPDIAEQRNELLQTTNRLSNSRVAKARLIIGDSSDSDSDEDTFVDAYSSMGRFETPSRPAALLSKPCILKHWSSGVEIEGVKASGEETTFFKLTKMIGLCHYVREKQDTGIIGDQDVNYHLLMHGLSSSFGKRSAALSPPNPDLVYRILEGGIDPNFSYTGMTPWEIVLHNVVSIFISPSDNPDWPVAANQWARIFRIFLEHGADPNKLTARHPKLPGQPRVTPLRVVERYIPPSLHQQKAELELLLRSKGARTDIEPKHVALIETPAPVKNEVQHSVTVVEKSTIAGWVKYLLRI